MGRICRANTTDVWTEEGSMPAISHVGAAMSKAAGCGPPWLGVALLRHVSGRVVRLMRVYRLDSTPDYVSRDFLRAAGAKKR